MKYYLIEIAEGDPKIAGKAIYEYNNLNEALANFHKKNGNARLSELYTSQQLLVINSENGREEEDKWVREVEPAAPAEE